MINKEQFVKIINRLQEAYDIQNKVNEIFRNATDNIISDFANSAGLMICHEDLIIELLENMFDNDIISYWIYELNYGKNYVDGCVVDEHDEIINIKTSEDLYDYLVSGLLK